MIDTLHLFPETYDLMEKARDYFKLHTNGLIFRRDFCFFIRHHKHEYENWKE
jgi:3'-phosphoadenosine 5'-phosphosulfate sulfotransferase (PAPS reductase)/FAD synthetase